jgi:SAM-dependent methyltransferase
VIEHLPDDRALAAEIARLLCPGGWFYVSSVLRGRYAWWFRRGELGWQIDPTHVREYQSEEAFGRALHHPDLELEQVRSRPLRFPLADPALRLAESTRLLSAESATTIYQRSPAAARVRDKLQLRVPGYFWVEAVGHKVAAA